MPYAEYSLRGNVVFRQSLSGDFEAELPSSGKKVQISIGEERQIGGFLVRVHDGDLADLTKPQEEKADNAEEPGLDADEMDELAVGILEYSETLDPQEGSTVTKPPPTFKSGLINVTLTSDTVLRHLEDLPAPPTDAPEIDGYYITKKLGEGGMGSVWKAVQLGTGRDVAIKTMLMARLSEEAKTRFGLEIEVTAQLDHPNIGRLYESRLDDELCFYAMELIEGSDLESVEEERQVGQQEALELMLGVCRAVQFAHQKGIIHRDLKPGNIMITLEGQPKVVDFGLAKLTDDKTPQDSKLTNDGAQLGTPAYMSPEQVKAKQEHIDTRSDVYALGVILYELLVGEHPHGLEGNLFVLFTKIMSEDIRPPRSVKPDLDRDLDALLLKALAREPADRYATAGEMADDLQRYLDGEPLLAQPQTTIYVLRKKIAKHRKKVLAVALVVFFTVAGLISSFILVRQERDAAQVARDQAQVARVEAERQHKEAEVQRARADKRFGNVRELANIFIHEFDSALQKGPTQARSLLVTSGGDYLRKLSEDAGSQTELLDDIGRAYRKSGDVELILLGGGGNKDVTAASQNYAHSVEVFDDLLKKDPAKVNRYTRERALSLQHLARAQRERGENDAAITGLKEARAAIDGLLGSAPDDIALRVDLATIDLDLGRVYAAQDADKEAVTASYMSALTAYDALLAGAIERPALKASVERNTIFVHVLLGGIARETDAAKAQEHFETAAAIIPPLLALEPNNVQLLMADNSINNGLGNLYLDQGKLNPAFEKFRLAVDVAQQLVFLDPTNVAALKKRAYGNLQMGWILYPEGKFTDASVSFQQAYRYYTSLSEADPKRSFYQRNRASSLIHKGEAQSRLGDVEAAKVTYTEAIPIAKKAAEMNTSTRYRRVLAWAHVRLMQARLDLGETKEFSELLQVSQAIVDGLIKDEPDKAYNKHVFAAVTLERGRLAQAQKNSDEALKHYTQALANLDGILEKKKEDADLLSDKAHALMLIGELHTSQGDETLAVASFKQASATLEVVIGLAPSNAIARHSFAKSSTREALALFAEDKGNRRKACRLVKKSLKNFRHIKENVGLSSPAKTDLGQAKSAKARICGVGF